MFQKIIDLVYTSRSNAWKAAVSTAVITFVSLFSISLLGFINDVTTWAASSDDAVFPSMAPLAKAFVSAFAASVTGLVNWVVRTLQAKEKVPGNGPTYN